MREICLSPRSSPNYQLSPQVAEGERQSAKGWLEVLPAGLQLTGGTCERPVSPLGANTGQVPPAPGLGTRTQPARPTFPAPLSSLRLYSSLPCTATLLLKSTGSP